VPHSVHALTAAAGLPADGLSASIVSFARFFSLPIKPELMAAIRQQALSQPAPQTAAQVAQPAQPAPAMQPAQAASQEAAARAREALALAASAAEAKGVELGPKGLAAYAEAIDPGWEKRQGSGERDARQDGGRQGDGEKKGALPKAEPLSAGGLREIALESAEANPLLAVMNRLPGRDGRRWIVLPFEFDRGGREFRVSMRVLLDGEAPAASRPARMVLDIAEAGRGWLFALELAGGAAPRLAVSLRPELPVAEAGSLARELSGATGIPAERISVKSRQEGFSGESSHCADNLLRSVHEAV